MYVSCQRSKEANRIDGSGDKKMGIFISRETLKNMGLEKFEVKILYAELKIRPLSCTRECSAFSK